MLLYLYIYNKVPVDVYTHIVEYFDSNYNICNHNKMWNIYHLFHTSYKITSNITLPYTECYVNALRNHISEVIKSQLIRDKLYDILPANIKLAPITIYLIYTDTYVFQFDYYINNTLHRAHLYQIHFEKDIHITKYYRVEDVFENNDCEVDYLFYYALTSNLDTDKVYTTVNSALLIYDKFTVKTPLVEINLYSLLCMILINKLLRKATIDEVKKYIIKKMYTNFASIDSRIIQYFNLTIYKRNLNGLSFFSHYCDPFNKGTGNTQFNII